MRSLSTMFAIMYFVIGISNAASLDDKSFDQLRTLMIDGCSLGMETSVRVEGDGSISFFRRGVDGSLSFSMSDVPTVINKLQHDSSRRAVASDTRACMERFMDKLFDAVLNRDTIQGEAQENQASPHNHFRIALNSLIETEDDFIRQHRFFDLAYATMCDGQFSNALEVFEHIDEDFQKQEAFYDFAGLALCKGDFDTAYQIAQYIERDFRRDHLLREISAYASGRQSCLEEHSPTSICARRQY